MKEISNTDANININGVDIAWELEKGTLSFLGISSTLFWNDPSLINMFKPLVKEIGKEMFCLQVAYSSSLGTDTDYNAMVTQLGDTFEEGFLNWGKAVSGAGWGTFEVSCIDFKANKAKVIVSNPWELQMQKNLDQSELWGCPFLQGKIIGIFNNAFDNTCWAKENYYFEEGGSRVEFDIYLYDLTIEEEIAKLRKSIETEKIADLNRTIEEKIKERDELLRKEEIQILINEKLEQRVKEEIEKNRLQEEQLRERTRMAQMGEMISMIAHQWRQPLGAISSTSINLQVKMELGVFNFKDDDGKIEFKTYLIDQLGKIDSFVKSLTNTIDDFRNFYKPNKKSKLVLVKEPLTKALGIVRASFESEGIEIIDSVGSSKKIRLHVNEIMQVVLNILKNSHDNFMEKGIKNPKIYISCEDIENGVLIKIKDNGGGIPEDILERIFDPYFSTKNEKNGTGLGLYMSKTMIEDHHDGILSAINEDDGVCFVIELTRIDE